MKISFEKDLTSLWTVLKEESASRKYSIQIAGAVDEEEGIISVHEEVPCVVNGIPCASANTYFSSPLEGDPDKVFYEQTFILDNNFSSSIWDSDTKTITHTCNQYFSSWEPRKQIPAARLNGDEISCYSRTAVLEVDFSRVVKNPHVFYNHDIDTLGTFEREDLQRAIAHLREHVLVAQQIFDV